MVHQYKPNFPHRYNEGGSFDSICTLCHLTVATAKVEAALSLYERSHKCDPVRIYEVSPYLPTPDAIEIQERLPDLAPCEAQ
jgi:hypothetical protein